MNIIKKLFGGRIPAPPYESFLDTIRSVFPLCTDAEVEYILWNETGYPAFWNAEDGHTPLECCHTQAVRLHDLCFGQEATA